MCDWKNFWDRLADSKDDLLSADWIRVSRRKYAERIEYIGKMLNLNKEDTLIDIGCGRGFFNYYSKKDIRSYIGLDFSWKLLFEGYRKKNTKKTACDFIQGNCKRLPFKNASINKILCNSVSQYFKKREFKEMISEIDRVLNEAGICFLGDVLYEVDSSLFNNKKMDSSYKIFFGLKSILKKIKFIVLLKSAITRTYLEIKNRIDDYKRGFKIHRKILNKYDPVKILNWIRDMNLELKCQLLEQGEYSFFPNRYDLLIKKSKNSPD